VTTPTLDDAARGWSPRRVLVVAVVAAMVAMWVYVLYLAFGPGRQPSPDRLADPAFGRSAQAVCESAHDEVAALPPAIDADSAAERAEIVDRANAIFTTMVDDLEPLAPDGEDGEVVAEWIADWRTYLQDRRTYADTLRQDPDARLFVTAKDHEQVTEYIDGFAADNDMPACATPIDV
jgi:hypothetical protein